MGIQTPVVLHTSLTSNTTTFLKGNPIFALLEWSNILSILLYETSTELINVEISYQPIMTLQ